MSALSSSADRLMWSMMNPTSLSQNVDPMTHPVAVLGEVGVKSSD
jgi:hypothetical protein